MSKKTEDQLPGWRRYAHRSSFELTALFIFLLVLISNLFVIQFAKGYFGYYGIDLSLVSFTPQMYEYAEVALPALTLTVAVVIAICLVLWINDRAAKWCADKMLSGKIGHKIHKVATRYKKALEFIYVLLGYAIKFISIVLILWAVWQVCVVAIPEMGKVSAAAKTELSSVSNEQSVAQEVIVYRGSSGVILKVYDTELKVFEEGYRVLPVSAEYSVRRITK